MNTSMILHVSCVFKYVQISIGKVYIIWNIIFKNCFEIYLKLSVLYLILKYYSNIYKRLQETKENQDFVFTYIDNQTKKTITILQYKERIVTYRIPRCRVVMLEPFIVS